MKRKRTISQHISHYYNNKVVKIGTSKILDSIERGEWSSASDAFPVYRKMIEGILSPFEVIDEISETNSSELPQEVKDALNLNVERFNSFKTVFQGICDEFPESLRVCPRTFSMALDMLGLEYDPVVEIEHLYKFKELY